MKICLNMKMMAMILMLMACSSVSEQSSVKNEASKSDEITRAVGLCQGSIIQAIYEKDRYGRIDEATLTVITNKEDLGKPDSSSILSEVDFNDSETDRWIVDFNGDNCQISSSYQFVGGSRGNTEMNPELKSNINKAMERCQNEVFSIIAPEAGYHHGNFEDFSMKYLLNDTETNEPWQLLVEVDINNSETDRWIVAFETVRNSCKVEWKTHFSYDR